MAWGKNRGVYRLPSPPLAVVRPILSDRPALPGARSGRTGVRVGGRRGSRAGPESVGDEGLGGVRPVTPSRPVAGRSRLRRRTGIGRSGGGWPTDQAGLASPSNELH